MTSDLFTTHAVAIGLYRLGMNKMAADLHFSGKLQVDSLGDLVLDVPSALLRGCLAAIKEPGVELHLGENWKSRVVVMTKTELGAIGGPKAVTERGKDFDYSIGQSASAGHEGGKVWYLQVKSPDLEKLRQAYGLIGEPSEGFRAIFGIRKPKIFQDGDRVSKAILGGLGRGAVSGGSEWVLKKSDLNSSVQLQPHQQALASEIGPEHPARKLMTWATGSGKCVRGNTPVPTAAGLRTIESLFVGIPADTTGWLKPSRPCRIVNYKNGVYSFQSVRRLYRERLSEDTSTYVVSTHRGNTLEATKEHEFLTFRGQGLVWVKAGELVSGDLVAMTTEVPVSVKRVTVPIETAELLGWQITEGYENPDDPWTSITQTDLSVLERIKYLFNQVVPSSPSGRIKTHGNGISSIVIWCAEYKRMLVKSGYAWGKKAKDKQLPDWVFSLSDDRLAVMLRAIFDAEGHAGKASVELTSASSQLLVQLQYLLLRFGIRSSHHYKLAMATNSKNPVKRKYGRISISGDDLEAFVTKIGFGYSYKQEAATRAAGKKRNPNCGLPLAGLLQELQDLSLLSSCSHDCQAKGTVSLANASTLLASLKAMLLPGGLTRWEQIGYNGKKRCGPRARQQCRDVVVAVNANRDSLVRIASGIEKMVKSNLRFERVVSVELGQTGGYVYDIEVEADAYDDANYVAGVGGFVVHNSLGALAAAEAFGQPYTVVGPAAMRPSFKNEQKRFTDQSLPSSVISYQKATQEGGIQHPDSLVIDEAQRIINPASRQSQAIQEAARKAKQVLLLSGTPIVNRPGDLAPIMSVLTGNDITPAGFEARYMGQEAKPRSWREWASGQPKQYEPIVRHRDELKALLDGHVDWYEPNKPNVPTKYTDHEVEMSDTQSRLYRAMFGKIPWKLRMGLDQSTDMTPAELQQMKAFLSGPRQVGLSDYPFASHGDPLKSFYGSTKLQLAFKNLKERLDSDPRAKGLVFSNFPTAGLVPYRAALQHHNIPHMLFDGSLSDAERDAAVKSFNDGRSRVALVGPAGAEGISLKGSQMAQLLESSWNEARMRQATARGIRFDSHTHLPPELNNIEVQRYISKLPAKQRSWLQTLRMSPYKPQPQPAADDILKNISDRKELSNKLFMDLLREVGTRKTPAPVTKQAKLVSIQVKDTCQCGHAIARSTSHLTESDDVICGKCGKSNYVLTSDEDRTRLLEAAAKETDTSVTKEQMHAGNYRKGMVGWQNLVIAIESPAGSVRRGTTRDGKDWETTLKDHYGYIRKHVSEADGDHVDVFISSEPDFYQDHVYVIDQYIGGKFDEHKCCILAKDAKAAKEIYHRNYQDGWDGFGNLSTLSAPEFIKWLAEGDTSRPLFVKVPDADVKSAERALVVCKEREKKVDPTGDDSGGGYGDVILCKRRGKAWLICGDWWSKKVCDLYLKELKKALPDYEWDCEAESTPHGYERSNMGDWAEIKHKHF